MLIIGKQNFLEIFGNLLEENNIKRVFLNGIIDKELISLIKKKNLEGEEEFDFKVVLPRINSKSLIVASSILKFGEIKTNIKSRGKFILIDNYLFYLSGNNKNLVYNIEDKEYIIHLKEDKAIYDLEKIFLKNWDKGRILYI